MDNIEHAIDSESRRIERIHPLEAKKIADQIDQDLAITERNIQSLKTDVNTLRNARYPQAGKNYLRFFYIIPINAIIQIKNV